MASRLPEMTGGKWLNFHQDTPIVQVFIDSRKYFADSEALFVAFRGSGHDARKFIVPLYEKGVRQFVISDEAGERPELALMPEANILLVKSPLVFLQRLAAYQRSQVNIPVIGITGSNGKTIIKEWLHEVLSPEHSIIKSPGSYNSQIGVPLSVLPINEGHTLGIFEAGISGAGQMDALREVIQPTLGIFTNLLSAHDEGFASRNDKAQEKARLFKNVSRVVCCADDPLVTDALKDLNRFTWGKDNRADVQIHSESGLLRVRFGQSSFEIRTGFSDPASVENISHVIALMLLMGYTPDVIKARAESLKRLPMRLEMKEGIQGCTIIDDTYSNDLSSLKLALDFLRSQRHTGQRQTIILSDLEQTGLPESLWAAEIGKMIAGSGVDEFIGIGPVLSRLAGSLVTEVRASGYADTEDLFERFPVSNWRDRMILVKGARSFRLEHVVERMLRRTHGTVMEVDMVALGRNLSIFRSALSPGIRLMVMVKAFAYGSGAAEVARFLEHHRVDYLGVAYTDEGVALRNQGISLPIMVMNPAPESAAMLATHQLEPAVYSRSVFQALEERLRGTAVRIHVKLDTGMHRLGFESEDIEWLCDALEDQSPFTVASVYSHLAASDEARHDDFSAEQARRFSSAADLLDARLGYRPMRHLLNTSGILRHPEWQFDMVRLGIGLYGAASASGLEQVLTLKTVISQIKNIGPGETVGYGRRGEVSAGSRIATVSIGYADGYSRAFSRGVGKMLVHGKLAPVVGNVCMDMTMIDVTGIDAREGDEVIIFGRDLPPALVASWINTIPYELLTSAGERVRRVFHSAG